MNITNNFFIVIFALIPIILYVFLVYYMIPKSFVSLDRGRRYLISGLMSPFLIFLVYFIFPNWGKQLNVNFLFDYVFFTVIQIGLLEEFSKYSIFQWVSSERISRKHDLPIATLYYSLMTSLGFALTENISYLIALYQNNSFDPFISNTQLNLSMLKLSLSRSLTAVIMHMICGVIIGYFISKSIEMSNKVKTSTKLFEHDFNFSNKIYIFIGIMFASIYHGVYDLNLMLPDNNYKTLFTVFIISFGLIIGHFMINNLIKESRVKRFCKMN
jgi:RsiW-degrading membrane proteinase PrsW (M82 family)